MDLSFSDLIINIFFLSFLPVVSSSLSTRDRHQCLGKIQFSSRVPFHNIRPYYIYSGTFYTDEPCICSAVTSFIKLLSALLLPPSHASQQECEFKFQRQTVRLTLDMFGELLQRSCQRGSPNVKHPSLKFKPL